VIDPGPALPDHIDALLVELEARGGAGAILLTHGHSDHAQAGPIVRERTGAPLAALDPGADLVLADAVRVGPLTTIATPGHAADHAAFLLGGVCFSGDLVLGTGSVMISPQPGSMAAYMASLARLQALELELIAPGHGPVVTDPAAKLDQYVAHRIERERQVLGALGEGVRDRQELLDRVWPAVPAELRAGAVATLAATLDKLDAEGRLPKS
jgi:glyoxylase-like metal-dependent hydrolase (beta-lactamase superfamily II)